MQIENVLTEALTGAVVTEKVAAPGGGILNLSLNRVDVADCFSNCSLVSAQGILGSGVRGISVENSSGATSVGRRIR